VNRERSLHRSSSHESPHFRTGTERNLRTNQDFRRPLQAVEANWKRLQRQLPLPFQYSKHCESLRPDTVRFPVSRIFFAMASTSMNEPTLSRYSSEEGQAPTISKSDIHHTDSSKNAQDRAREFKEEANAHDKATPSALPFGPAKPQKYSQGCEYQARQILP